MKSREWDTAMFKLFARLMLLISATSLLVGLPLDARCEMPQFNSFFRINERKALKAMSIEEKIGQIFIFGFAGDTLDADYQAWLSEGRVGNVKIFARNVDSKQQLRDLTTFVALRSMSSPSCIPPFIATDLEGGTVNHVRYPGMPSIPAAARIENRRQCREVSRTIAHILSETGINMNFAPCADVITNAGNRVIGNRSYSSNPRVVATMALTFILEHERAGIMTTVKHFPGHGMTRLDSHYEAESVDTGLKELKKIHLLPYRKLIRKGFLHSVMLAHVTYDALDPANPATFSAQVVEHLLRGKMHFRGITVTDDLEMESAEGYAGGIEQAFVLAFEAGNDLFLVAHSKRKQALLLKRVPELFRTGVLSEDELDERVLRILRIKKRYLSCFYQNSPPGH
jgi:beta-N-acetylhexosaminidase